MKKKKNFSYTRLTQQLIEPTRIKEWKSFNWTQTKKKWKMKNEKKKKTAQVDSLGKLLSNEGKKLM